MSEEIEQSLRSDAWAPGVAMVLSNGEAFQFERPEFVGFYPVFDQKGNISRKLTIHFGREFEDCLDSADEAARQSGDIWPYVAWMADKMLTNRNYKPDIRHHYREILSFSREDKSMKLWFAIYDIARGIDPKERTSNG